MGQYENYNDDLFIALEKKVTKDGVRGFIESIPFEGEVIDIGCGYSPYRSIISRPEVNYLGIDPNLKLLSIAESLANKSKFNISFKEGHAQKIPECGNKFDYVVSTFCFTELETPTHIRTALSEIFRIIKPGGMLVFSDLSGGINDAYYNLLNMAEVLRGELPYRDVTDVWIEVLSFIAMNAKLLSSERTKIVYEFNNLKDASYYLSSIIPDLIVSSELNERLDSLLDYQNRFVCEAFCVKAILKK